MEESDSIIGILLKASGFSIIIPIAVGLMRYKRLDAGLTVLVWLLLISILFEAVMYFTGERGINNHLIGNPFIIIQYLFLSAVFYLSFGSYIIRKGIVVVAVLFVVFGIANLLSMQGHDCFNTWTLGIACLLLMLVALLFYYELFKEGKVQRLERYPLFWVASAVLVYAAGCFFLFIFSNYALEESKELLYVQWSIHSVINIVTNLCYAVGLWLSPGK